MVMTANASRPGVRAGVLLDDLADGERGLLQATAALADELLQTYGYPETGLITRAGT
jgi:hypothetical protein